ncbi:MAG: CxxxxCH/CxxCH domain-containing protein [Candidatus Latescibacterota bacterium]
MLFSCSTERDPTTLPGAHSGSWMDLDSEDFHGRFVLEDGTSSCMHCHGIDSPGGRVGISCLDCHGRGDDACVACHGGMDNDTGAPPAGLRGQLSDTTIAVGAHTAHLESSALAAPFACNVCHIVPLFVLSPSHLDQARPLSQPLDSIAEIVWHGIADGGNAVWERGSRTCSATYCHGNFTGGFLSNHPIWTSSNQAGCGSCHDVGANPETLHWEHHAYHVDSAGLSCADCHASVVNTSFDIIGLSLHVNGQVDTLIRDPAVCAACHGSGPDACTRCHGGADNLSGAPPLGLQGETTTSQLAVGAHTTHMEGGTLADAFACSDCHRVPSNFLAPGHFGPDSTAEMTWSALAGAASSWNRTSATCSNIYCHGNFTGGFRSNRPIWIASNQAGCGSCHDVGGNPENLSGRHDKHVREENLACNECHASVVNQQLLIIDSSLHVNGTKNVSLLRGGTYQNSSCSGLSGTNCHDPETWY